MRLLLMRLKLLIKTTFALYLICTVLVGPVTGMFRHRVFGNRTGFTCGGGVCRPGPADIDRDPR